MLDFLTMPFIIGAAILLVLIIFLTMGYKKASPDKGLVISGLRKEARMVKGRGAFIVPFFEKTDDLYLKQVTVPVSTIADIPTNDLISVSVDAIFKIQVCTETPELEKRAMVNFLNKDPEAIIEDTQDALLGNLREVIGAMKLEEIIKEKDKFSTVLKDTASGDMENLGLTIVTCNIQGVNDQNNMIRDLGAYNTEKIKRTAAIEQANAQKDIAIATAEAEKKANDARVAAALEMEKKQNELEIQQAQLKRNADEQRAIADAAFEIQHQQQQKTIKTESVNAEIAQRERMAELAMKEVEVERRRLEAEVREKAEAERFREQQEADAKLYVRTREAEAAKIEEERKAEAQKVRAEAERFEKEEVAKAIKAQGLAEAQAIAAKGKAEAEAILEKAEAMKQFGQAAILEMVVDKLPEIAASVAAPLASIDKVSIIGSDSSGVAGISSNVPVVMAQAFESVKDTIGIDLADIVKAQGFEAKTTRNVNLTGIPEAPGVAQTPEVVITAKEIEDVIEEAVE